MEAEIERIITEELPNITETSENTETENEGLPKEEKVCNVYYSDHTLTLKTLHDKHIRHSNNEKIYACFVDFRKAFDPVWRQGLFYQLIKNNIGGHDLIKDLYSNTKCAIILSNNRRKFAKGVC